MTGYPPKCPQNGVRHYSARPTDPWPGDTWTDSLDRLWVFQSDGSGWAAAGLATDQAAE